MKVNQNIRVHAALFSVAVLYSANYTVAKFIIPTFIAPYGFILLRVLSAGFLFWCIPTKKERITTKDFLLLALCSVFGVAFNQLAFFKGLSMTNPINAAIVMTTIPMMVMLTAYLLGRERITLIKALGLTVGAMGAYLLVTKDGVDFENRAFVGDMLVLLNAISFAVYLVLVKPLMVRYGALAVVKWLFFFGALMILPFGYGEFMAIDWPLLSSKVLWSIVFVVVGATLLTYLLNAWALRSVNASVVGIYIYLQPVLATGIAIVVRNDTLSLETLLYSVLIMLGVYLVSKR